MRSIPNAAPKSATKIGAVDRMSDVFEAEVWLTPRMKSI